MKVSTTAYISYVELKMLNCVWLRLRLRLESLVEIGTGSTIAIGGVVDLESVVRMGQEGVRALHCHERGESHMAVEVASVPRKPFRPKLPPSLNQ
jgi:hypothetical protein